MTLKCVWCKELAEYIFEGASVCKKCLIEISQHNAMLQHIKINISQQSSN